MCMKPTMTEEERILTLEEKVARLQFDVYALQSKMDLMADRKTENSSEIPNNCETEPQTYVINPQEPTNDEKCFECDDFFTCDGQCDEVEDEPQTEEPSFTATDFGKGTITRYTDEPQTDCAWK